MDRWFSLTIRAKFYFLFFSFIPEFLLFVEAQLHDKYKHQFSNKIVKYIHTSNMQWWKWGMFLTVAIKKCLFLFFFFSYTNVYIYITYKETEIKLLLDYQIIFKNWKYLIPFYFFIIDIQKCDCSNYMKKKTAIKYQKFSMIQRNPLRPSFRCAGVVPLYGAPCLTGHGFIVLVRRYADPFYLSRAVERAIFHCARRCLMVCSTCRPACRAVLLFRLRALPAVTCFYWRSWRNWIVESWG